MVKNENVYVKDYDAGSVVLDVPNIYFIHQKSLCEFGGEKGRTKLDLIFNSRYIKCMEDEQEYKKNYFNIIPGLKLNIQKKIISYNEEEAYLIDERGKIIRFYGEENALISENKGEQIMHIGEKEIVVSDKYNNREVYNLDGNLNAVYGRYGTEPMYTYSYDSGKLISVADSMSRKISLKYNADEKLEAVTINDQEKEIYSIQLLYNGENVTVKSFTGVDTEYQLGEERSVIYTKNSEETYSDYCEKITADYKTKAGKSILMIQKEVGDRIVQKDTYTFLNFSGFNECDFFQVENKEGVKVRYQYYGKQLEYKYEVDGGETTGEDMFYIFDMSNTESRFKCDVEIAKSGAVMGKLAQEPVLHGAYMNNDTWFFSSVPIKAGQTNSFVLSGWIKSENGYSPTIYLSRNNSELEPLAEYTILSLTSGYWQFFSKEFYLNSNVTGNCELYILMSPSSEKVSQFRDVRITPSGKDLLVSKEILFHKGDLSQVLVENIINIIYEKNGETVKEGISLSVENIDRYFLDRARGITSNDFITGDYRKGDVVTLIPNCSNIRIEVNDGENVKEYNLDDFYTGISTDDGNTVITTYNCYDEEGVFKRVHKKIEKDGTSKELMEDYNRSLDILKREEGELRYEYIRNEYGEVTEQKVTGKKILSEKTGYSADGDKIEWTEDAEGNKTYFETEEFFGVPKKVTLSEGLEINYDYDSGKTSLTEIRFEKNQEQIKSGFEYAEGEVSAVTQEEQRYSYEYDKGRLVAVKEGETEVVNIEYSEDERTVTANYGNEYSVSEVIDKYGRLSEILYGDTCIFRNTYDRDAYEGAELSGYNNGSSFLRISEDVLEEEKTYYEYDLEKVKKEYVYDTYKNTIKREKEYTYDGEGRLIKEELTRSEGEMKNITKETEYEAAEETGLKERIKGIKYSVNGEAKVTNKIMYDEFDRINEIEEEFGNSARKSELEYNTEGTRTSPELKTLREKIRKGSSGAYETEREMNYLYDKEGRITEEKDTVDTENHISYKYDEFGRLKRENNEKLDKTIIYEYNKNGNITSVKSYGYTESEEVEGSYTEKMYKYEDETHKDRLTSYNGQDIKYDLLGEPIIYRGKEFNFEKGKLTGYGYGNILSGTTRYRYSYDAKGRRIKKSYTYSPGKQSLIDYMEARDTEYEYSESGLLMREKITETYHQGGSSKEEREYVYDLKGIAGVIVRKNGEETEYYYGRDIQGNVRKIYNKEGEEVGSYDYEAYGKAEINEPSGFTNPIRYRSYYYDTETGLYYVGARYYDAETGRFISPDDVSYLDPESINGLNRYAYCFNNPVMYSDGSGHVPEWIVGIGRIITGIGAVVAGTLVIVSGVALVPMLITGGITIAAGTLTTINGVADIQQSITGNNFIRDGIFGGNQTAYNWYAGITEGVAVVGSIVCGGWLKTNQPRIQAYKNIENYAQSKTVAGHTDRVYNNSILLQKQIIKYGKMTKDLHSATGYVFSVAGSLNGSVNYWRLVLSNAERIIWHFGFGF